MRLCVALLRCDVRVLHRSNKPSLSPPFTPTQNRWVFADAAVVSAARAAPFAWHYALPGAAAMLGVLLLGAAGRAGRDVDASLFADEGEACRAKCVLFLAYVIAFGSIFAAATLLVLDHQKNAPLWPAAAATIQATALSASGLLLWLSVGGDDDGYAAI
jgi:hypothetical protein